MIKNYSYQNIEKKKLFIDDNNSFIQSLETRYLYSYFSILFIVPYFFIYYNFAKASPLKVNLFGRFYITLHMIGIFSLLIAFLPFILLYFLFDNASYQKIISEILFNNGVSGYILLIFIIYMFLVFSLYMVTFIRLVNLNFKKKMTLEEYAKIIMYDVNDAKNTDLYEIVDSIENKQTKFFIKKIQLKFSFNLNKRIARLEKMDKIKLEKKIYKYISFLIISQINSIFLINLTHNQRSDFGISGDVRFHFFNWQIIAVEKLLYILKANNNE